MPQPAILTRTSPAFNSGTCSSANSSFPGLVSPVSLFRAAGWTICQALSLSGTDNISLLPEKPDDNRGRYPTGSILLPPLSLGDPIGAIAYETRPGMLPDPGRRINWWFQR